MTSRRDWSRYNKELINRGKINFWIKPKTRWKAPKRKKNGHPFVYADLNAWYPLVKGHGILCGDDLEFNWPLNNLPLKEA